MGKQQKFKENNVNIYYFLIFFVLNCNLFEKEQSCQNWEGNRKRVNISSLHKWS